MKRRDFLKTSLAFPLLGAKLQAEDQAKNVLLYNYVKSALHSQVDPSLQAGKDCVSHAITCGINILQAIEHFLDSDTWYGSVASEFIHVGTIKKILKSKRTVDRGFAVKDGIKFVKEYGVLFRRVYGDYDFTNYNYNNCKQLWRRLPNSLLLECKKHPIKTTVKVSSWEEAKNAIFNLQPVIISSDIGFINPESTKLAQKPALRDKDGFVKPRGKWYHAWTLIGIKDDNRPGGCLMSSDGKNWVKGPKGLNQPDGSIWVDALVLHKMLKEYGASYAIADFQ